MIYILYGEEEYFIRRKIASFREAADADVVFFDGSDRNFSISAMLEACTGNSLFANRNTILVSQPYFLIRRCSEEELSELLEYVQKPFYETDLILYTYANDFNSKLKAFKQIAVNAEVIQYKQYDYKRFNDYVRQRNVETGLNLPSELIFHLGSICKRSVTLFEKNLEILKLYPEQVSLQVIDRLCTASDENAIFDMINALTMKNISKAIEIQRRLLKETDSVLGSISLLANQLRFMYEVSYLRSTGKKKAEIMDITNVSEYKLNKTLQACDKISENQMLELLHKLHELDLLCKADNSLPDTARFELFIMELLSKENHAVN